MNSRIVPLMALVLVALAPLAARAETVVASPWLDFSEAKIRLLAVQPKDRSAPLVAGLEIQLAPDFKTYWRSAGDSGVPPSFDFSKSTGLGDVRVDFPFPGSFDDGAGGKAWGYKHTVILPISAPRTGSDVHLALKLDFAVCGTMCIPLSGELQLNTARANAVSAVEAKALDLARLALPVRLADDAKLPVTTKRQLPINPPLWVVRLPFKGPIEDFSAFPEATGFLEVTSAVRDGEGVVRLTIGGQAASGSNGKFGPVRLTYGKPGDAFERMIDLDGAAPTP